MRGLVRAAFWLLKLAPLGVVFKFLPFLPSLDKLLDGAVNLVSVVAKLAASAIEGVLETLHRPKVLWVVGAAFLWGLYLSDGKPNAPAPKATVESRVRYETLFRTIFRYRTVPTKREGSDPECVVPGLSANGWCF